MKDIARASSIAWHTDFHAALRNSLFAAEFAACRGKTQNYPYFATFISNSRFFGLLFNFLPFIKQEPLGDFSPSTMRSVGVVHWAQIEASALVCLVHPHRK